MRNSPATTKVRGGGGGGRGGGGGGGEEVLQAPEERFPCCPWAGPKWSRHCPAALGEEHARAGIHTAGHRAPRTGGRGYFLKKLWPVQSPRGSRFIPRDCGPWEGPHAGAGEKCEEGGAAERSWYGLSTAPIPHAPAPLGGVGRGIGNRRGAVKLSVGKKGWGGGGVFSFVFVAHFPKFLIGNKVNRFSPSQVWFGSWQMISRTEQNRTERNRMEQNRTAGRDLQGPSSPTA